MDSIKRVMCVSFALFQRSYLVDGRVSEVVATVEELIDHRIKGAMDGFSPWRTVVVFDCSYLFQAFDS